MMLILILTRYFNNNNKVKGNTKRTNSLGRFFLSIFQLIVHIERLGDF